MLFGGTATGTPDPVSFEVTGSFAGYTVSASIVHNSKLTITGTFGGWTASASMRYDSNTTRPTVSKVDSIANVATKAQVGTAAGQQVASAAPAGWTAGQGMATKFPVGFESKVPNNMERTRIDRAQPQQAGTGMRDSLSGPHQDADRTLRLMLNTAFENASLARLGSAFPQQVGTVSRRSLKTSAQDATRARLHIWTDAQSATPSNRAWYDPFQRAMPPIPGITLPPGPPVVPPPFSCYDPDGNLLFELPWQDNGFLIFKCDGGTVEPPPGPTESIIVPVREVYIVTNNVTLRRVSDNAEIPATSMALSLDVDSWTWSFSATLPGQALAFVEPTGAGPVELKATVNGTEFRVLAEKISRDRTFGRMSIRVSGRGRNALLDAPYAAVQTFGNDIDRTAQQLMGDVLTFNGVPLGWSINWQLTDWLVPAGVFNHQGTYISALGEIAKSAGAFLLPHPNATSFTVKHLYPTAPWNWGSVTPDFVLPADVTTREGLEWVEKPEYNRVYVSGQGEGVLGRVTRQGTAGDIAAPMVVDQLITDMQAARQRGIAILGDTGRQIRVDLRLPVLQATGIIQPGAFVRYEDGATTRLGIVRGTSVDTQLASVWQSLEIETHI